MEPLEGPPVSSPDPAIISSVEQQASSSTHAVSDMLSGSPSVMTHTPQSCPARRSDFASDLWRLGFSEAFLNFAISCVLTEFYT